MQSNWFSQTGDILAKAGRQQLPPNAEVSVHHRNKLTVANLNQDDEGKYICVAENVFGVAESSAQLFIHGQ